MIKVVIYDEGNIYESVMVDTKIFNSVDEAISYAVRNADNYISIDIITEKTIVTILDYRVYSIKERR